jgi:hypothetical protein
MVISYRSWVKSEVANVKNAYMLVYERIPTRASTEPAEVLLANPEIARLIGM